MCSQLFDSDIFLDVSQELLHKGKSVRFEARGLSMQPVISDGDIVTINPIEKELLSRGDVVLHLDPDNQILVHRILKITQQEDKKFALIRGDAIMGTPDIVPFEDILGRITLVETNGRVKSLDTFWYKIISKSIAITSPVVNWALPFLIRAKRLLFGTR